MIAVMGMRPISKLKLKATARLIRRVSLIPIQVMEPTR